MNENKPKRRWGRWVGLALLLLILLVVGGHWNWGVSADKRLRSRVAELRARGEPMLPEDFRQAAVADADNLALDLRAAGRMIDGRDPAWQAFMALEEFRLPMTEKERAAMAAATAKYAEALRRVRQARGKTAVDWQLTFGGPMLMMLLPDLNPSRDLAQLIAANAMLAHEAGDDAEAVESIRDVLKISGAADRMPFLVGHLVAIGISAIATDRAEQITPGLKIGAGDKAATREQVTALIGELLDETTLSDGQRQGFRGERAAGLDTLRRIHAGQLSLNAATGGGGGNPPAQSAMGYALKPMLLGDAELIVAFLTHVIAALDKPTWPQFRAAAPDIQGVLEAAPLRHMMARMFLPALDRAVERHYRILAERRMAAVALALRLYALDHEGKMPAKLEELSPKYLPAVPPDPMAAAARGFGYKPEGERPMLYSVGSNGEDDGGSDEPVQKRQGTSVFYGKWDRMDAVFELRLQERPEPEEKPEQE